MECLKETNKIINKQTYRIFFFKSQTTLIRLLQQKEHMQGYSWWVTTLRKPPKNIFETNTVLPQTKNCK